MNFAHTLSPISALVGGVATSILSEYAGISNPMIPILGAAATGSILSKIQEFYTEQKDNLPGSVIFTDIVDKLQQHIGIKFCTIIINSKESVIYNKIKSYILDKYAGLLTQSSISKSNSVNISLGLSNSIFSKPIYDHYEGERLVIKICDGDIKISSRTLSVEKIKQYIKHLLTIRLGLKKINVHQPVITSGDSPSIRNVKITKESTVTWNTFSIQTNKNFSNTILTDKAKKELVDDLEKFAASEEYYNRKGLPYQRGYLLYGPPGTGKTSIIKSIASFYSMDIFIINMGEISTEQELSLVFQGTRTCDGYHMLCFEDIDRCEFLNRNFCNNGQMDSESLIRAFLNELDGVMETPKRITILTANDKSCIERIAALVRPGRIDRQVHLTYCDADQLCRLFNHFSDCKEKLHLDSLSSEITPAQAVKYILQNPTITPEEFKNSIGVIAKLEVKENQLSRGSAVRGKKRTRIGRYGSVVERRRHILSRQRQRIRKLKTTERNLPRQLTAAQKALTKAEILFKKSTEVEKKRKLREKERAKKERTKANSARTPKKRKLA